MSMTILWIAVAAGISAALVKWTWPHVRTRNADADYGSVSHQWVAEHRLTHGDDHRR